MDFQKYITRDSHYLDLYKQFVEEVEKINEEIKGKYGLTKVHRLCGTWRLVGFAKEDINKLPEKSTKEHRRLKLLVPRLTTKNGKDLNEYMDRLNEKIHDQGLTGLMIDQIKKDVTRPPKKWEEFGDEIVEFWSDCRTKSVGTYRCPDVFVYNDIMFTRVPVLSNPRLQETYYPVPDHFKEITNLEYARLIQ